MSTRYELRTFGDIVKSVLETLKIQASDTESVNRIKRNINMVYLNHVVPASNSWDWLSDVVTASMEPYFDSGTANVQQNVTTVTLSQAPATSRKGYYLTIDSNNEIYRIATHAAGSTTLTLESPFNGSTDTAARFKIWTDKVYLPPECMKVREVITTNASAPLMGVSIQQFRKHQISGGALIGTPTYYAEGGEETPAPYESISGLPAVVRRSSDNLEKKITFAADIGNFITEGERLYITSPSSYSYAGVITATKIEGANLYYSTRLPVSESDIPDTTLVVERVKAGKVSPVPTMLVHPAIQPRNQRVNLVVDYQMFPSELVLDSDEPLVPKEHRSVLFFGAMWLSADRETDLDRSDRYNALMQAELQRMLTRGTSIPKTPTMRISNSYIKTKIRTPGRSRYSQSIASEPFSGGGSISGNAPTATGIPNSVAVFDENGYLIGSADIDITQLEFLLGTQGTKVVNATASTSTTIDEFNATEYKGVWVYYNIQRGATWRAGTLIVGTDGSTIRFADQGPTEIGVTGVDFRASLSGGNVRVIADLDGSGPTATISYKVNLI